MFRNLFLLLVIFLYACSSIEDTLTLKKKPSGDEFLVEKKNPLTMPPEYGELPEPKTDDFDKNNKNVNEQNDIKQILSGKEKEIENNENKQTSSSSVEKLILENVK